MLLTLASFLVAIGLLVAVHEWGHFAMARACGVRVLQFSVGFGPRIAAWTSPRSGTEYRIGLLPLGVFVKMLDEREAAVAPSDLPFAFNRQPLMRRAAIVAAGPLANLGLALVLYSCVNWMGVTEAQAVVSRPTPQSLAERAGFVGGEHILQVGFAQEPLADVRSYEDFRWWLTRAALEGQDLQVIYRSASGQEGRSANLPLAGLDVRHADSRLFSAIGFTAPFSPARIGEVVQGSAAEAAGLLPGDQVLQVDAVRITDAAQLRALIRESGTKGDPLAQRWLLLRGGDRITLDVTPRMEVGTGPSVARVGAMIGGVPEMVRVRYGFWEGMGQAVTKTWEVSALTLRMMGQIVMGSAALSNLSGPITIADYAGKSAALGLEQFLVFLALISISLGVLNLLPLPVLDGGHLMYYLWEGITGRAVSEAWLSRLQRLGLVLLLAMMSVAIFNDVARILA